MNLNFVMTQQSSQQPLAALLEYIYQLFGKYAAAQNSLKLVLCYTALCIFMCLTVYINSILYFVGKLKSESGVEREISHVQQQKFDLQESQSHLPKTRKHDGHSKRKKSSLSNGEHKHVTTVLVVMAACSHRSRIS